VSYAPTVEGSGTLTLDLTGDYRTNVTCELRGAPTTRALLTVSEDTGFFGCTDAACIQPVTMIVEPGATDSRRFVVSNRGGAATTALGVGTPWRRRSSGTARLGDIFPGGSGAGTVNGVDYPYCTTATLGVASSAW